MLLPESTDSSSSVSATVCAGLRQRGDLWSCWLWKCCQRDGDSRLCRLRASCYLREHTVGLPGQQQLSWLLEAEWLPYGLSC